MTVLAGKAVPHPTLPGCIEAVDGVVLYLGV